MQPVDLVISPIMHLACFRYLGSKAVKLFKVRMHGSDAVSTHFLLPGLLSR